MRHKESPQPRAGMHENLGLHLKMQALYNATALEDPAWKEPPGTSSPLDTQEDMLSKVRAQEQAKGNRAARTFH